MTYLSLDLGTTTGWALGRKVDKHGVHIVSGTQSFQYNSRFEGGGLRFLRFTAWLDELYSTKRFGRIAFEEVRFAATTDAAHVYGGFLATLTSWAELNKVPYEAVPIGTIKKHATGKGNASKKEMVDAAVRRGHAPKDDNEADALALMHWMLNTYATPSTHHHRHAPDVQPQGPVPLEAVRLPRRPVSR
jgi:Holliday junction resolvasome RuvABC endonuclease subunit